MTPVLRSRNGTPIVGIAGWKNSGKTSLTARLVAHFAALGLDVATVKHAHHAFDIDDGETDSARHRRAGAGQVAVVSSVRWAIVREYRHGGEPDLLDVLERLDPCDLVIVEGYKSAPIAKIEARRLASLDRAPLSPSDPNVIAIAADHAVTDAGAVPVFALDDTDVIARHIAARIGLRLPREA